MKRLVTDTGPILHLAEADALKLLPLIGTVFVPDLVIREIHSHSSIWQESLPEWLHYEALSPSSQRASLSWQQAGLLHGGEADALALANQIHPDWFLTDDIAARLMAESIGIETHGSIGILLYAAATQLIEKTESERYLTGLEHSSLWLSSRVRREARSALAKIFQS